MSYIPLLLEEKVRTGGVEPPQHEATGLQPAELADAQRPHELRVAGRARTGASGDHNPGCFRLHHGHHESGDDRTRTGGLSPDKRALCSSELRPRGSSAGGIRTHGLELMRLARTASPLPRKSGWQESNLRSPAPEAGGVAKLPYSQMNDRSAPPAGFEPAASGLRARRHRRFDHGGMQLRRQDSNLPLAINSRASYRLDHAGTKNGGSRTRTCERLAPPAR